MGWNVIYWNFVPRYMWQVCNVTPTMFCWKAQNQPMKMALLINLWPLLLFGSQDTHTHTRSGTSSNILFMSPSQSTEACRSQCLSFLLQTLVALLKCCNVIHHHPWPGRKRRVCVCLLTVDTWLSSPWRPSTRPYWRNSWHNDGFFSLHVCPLIPSLYISHQF